jgi:hypothetical protein
MLHRRNGRMAPLPAAARFSGKVRFRPEADIRGSSTRFDIYGRYVVEVVREGSQWKVFSIGEGKRVLASNIVIPPNVPEQALATYLDDLLHELATPGRTIRAVE